MPVSNMVPCSPIAFAVHDSGGFGTHAEMMKKIDMVFRLPSRRSLSETNREYPRLPL